MVVRKDWWERVRGRKGEAEQSKVEKATGWQIQVYDGSRSADRECNESAGTTDEEKLDFYKPRRRPTPEENMEALKESNASHGSLLGHHVRTDGEKGKAWRILGTRFGIQAPGWKMKAGHCRKQDCCLRQNCATLGIKVWCASCKRKGTTPYLKPNNHHKSGCSNRPPCKTRSKEAHDLFYHLMNMKTPDGAEGITHEDTIQLLAEDAPTWVMTCPRRHGTVRADKSAKWLMSKEAERRLTREVIDESNRSNEAHLAEILGSVHKLYGGRGPAGRGGDREGLDTERRQGKAHTTG